MLKALAWALIALLLSMLPEWAKAGQPELSGRWTTADRGSLIEIAACPDMAGALCATVLADQPAAGQPSLAGKQVGINFVPGKDGWSGQILTEDGSALAATISLANASRLDLKVCVMAVFCDATSYWRVAP
ncbi:MULTISPECIES: DUF2147 domain-containing protein [unclassified Devosia]|jgi:hypothetical protein|uniref:DUF2147 domain-containing protein n=1 Tax=unclassified Devosia TaxID=196773 RepID=UPI00086EFCFA|nr:MULTISPECIES: DUF2147 domain-containing protein [unclassified Devosia]MBN9360543.1 DUF2147 domain-containing protein [Devosia sp.]ODS82353.1 MAG: hypothetical protein ABS47_22680 [Devosia sp. SCN 66-27]OJX22538.1 MAG: hypothetical protein BGO83_17130 [Devosia sp. 66-14]